LFYRHLMREWMCIGNYRLSWTGKHYRKPVQRS